MGPKQMQMQMLMHMQLTMQCKAKVTRVREMLISLSQL
jgi:hypothetical protein